MGDICDVVKIKTSTAERFIDKYIPIKIQTQISETLYSVLGKSYLDKLEQFEFEKYQELNNNVLCEEQVNVPDEMKAQIDMLIQAAHKTEANKHKKLIRYKQKGMVSGQKAQQAGDKSKFSSIESQSKK